MPGDKKTRGLRRKPLYLVIPDPTLHLASDSTSPLPLVEAVDSVFISSYSSACDLAALKAAGITHILNLTYNCPNQFQDHFEYCSVPMHDRLSTDIHELLPQTTGYIARARAANARVLVHCSMGKSRSPTVVCAFAVWKLGVTASAAWELIRRAQPKIDPSLGFVVQVQNFADKLKHAAYS